MRTSTLSMLVIAACGRSVPTDAVPHTEDAAVATDASPHARPAPPVPPPPQLPQAPELPPVPDLPPSEVAAEPPTDKDGWRRGTVVSGDSLSRIASGAGVDSRGIAALVTALAPVMDPATIAEGQRWAVRLDDAGELAEFTISRNATTTIEVARNGDGALVAESVTAETTIETVTISATIDSSLSMALVEGGGNAALVASVVDVFASDIDFYTDPRRGDRVAVIVERHMLDGAFVRHGRILAAAYRGEVGEIRGLWWDPPGATDGSWYTPEGRSLDRTLLKSPLKYARMSSGFDPKRMHPVLHRTKGHYGVDYAAPTGTPVWAAAGGQIAFRGEKGGAGNMVVLRHDGGFVTVYMHLSKFAAGQKVGQKVAQKVVIGYVGTTGLSTGPHLHFGVKRGGRWVDPASVRAIERPGVPAKQRAAFRRDTAALASRLDALLEATPEAPPPEAQPDAQPEAQPEPEAG